MDLLYTTSAHLIQSSTLVLSHDSSSVDVVHTVIYWVAMVHCITSV